MSEALFSALKFLVWDKKIQEDLQLVVNFVKKEDILTDNQTNIINTHAQLGLLTVTFNR